MTPRRRTRVIIVALLHVNAAAIVTLIVRGKLPSQNRVVEQLTALGAETKLAIEKWCGEQLLAMARGYLNPEINFSSIQYQYPATVTLSDVTLISGGVTFIAADSMRVDFTETPVAGQPLVIQTVELINPVVRLIRRPEGGLVGFSSLVRRQSELPADGGPQRLSDVFAIRRLAIVNGVVEYHVPGRPPMVLDQLTFDLASTPAHQTDPTQAGWYAIDALLARHPLFRWKVDGGINVDVGVLRFDHSTLDMRLIPEQYALLLPDVQAVVRDHEVTGQLQATIDGLVPLRRGVPMQLDLSARLTQGHIAFGEYVLPVDQLDLVSHLNETDCSIESMEYRGLGGGVSATGNIRLQAPYTARASIDARELSIEEAMRPGVAHQTQLKGKLSVKGDASADLAIIDTTCSGSGQLSITEGHLVEVPVISSLLRAVKLAYGSDAGSDRASADLRLAGDRLHMSNIDLVSGPMGASGDGHVRFNSTLDFRIHAGPFRGLRNSLGAVGDVLNRVTEGLVVYDVTGTIDAPIVSVHPLGIGGGQSSAR